MGRLDTRYAPVRRSPSNQASLIHAAPRLACVKPVASVHPEPGSNSSLYYLVFSFFLQRKGKRTPEFALGYIGLVYRIQNRRFDSHFLYYFLSMEICQKSLAIELFSSFAGAKVRRFFGLTKYFESFFLFFFFFLAILA